MVVPEGLVNLSDKSLIQVCVMSTLRITFEIVTPEGTSIVDVTVATFVGMVTGIFVDDEFAQINCPVVNLYPELKVPAQTGFFGSTLQ